MRYENCFAKAHYYSLFPFVVRDIHVVVILVFRVCAIAPTPYVQQKQGFCMKIRFSGVIFGRREAENEFKVYGVLGWRLPL